MLSFSVLCFISIEGSCSAIIWSSFNDCISSSRGALSRRLASWRQAIRNGMNLERNNRRLSLLFLWWELIMKTDYIWWHLLNCCRGWVNKWLLISGSTQICVFPIFKSNVMLRLFCRHHFFFPFALCYKLNLRIFVEAFDIDLHNPGTYLECRMMNY